MAKGGSWTKTNTHTRYTIELHLVLVQYKANQPTGENGKILYYVVEGISRIDGAYLIK